MHTTASAEPVPHLSVRGYIARAATVPEGWPSGLRRTLGKRVYGKPYRGFESHSLRQIYLRSLDSLRSLAFRLRVQMPAISVAALPLHAAHVFVSAIFPTRTKTRYALGAICCRSRTGG